MNALRAVTPLIETQYRLRLADAILGYIQAHGLEGTYHRVNGKTVATILEEAEAGSPPDTVEKGQVDGMTYTLLKAKDDEARQEHV